MNRVHRLYGHIIREHLSNGNRKAALDSLKSLGTVAAHKQLAATKFEEERLKSSPNWSNVYNYLKKIPTTTRENKTFYNLYDKLINVYKNGRSIYDLKDREINYLDNLEDDTTITASSHARSYLRLTEDRRFRYFPHYDNNQSYKMAEDANNEEDKESESSKKEPSPSFNVYPNPFENQFVVAIQMNEKKMPGEGMTLSVMDPLGQSVIEKEGISSQQERITFDASRFAHGVYLVRLTDGSKTLQQKRIVKIE